MRLTISEFPRAFGAAKRQASGFNVPWLDQLKKRKKTPYEILISCILSLRTKDETTAESSKRLFRLAGTPQEMVRLRTKTIEKAIYPAGFYRVKAVTIRELSRVLLEEHGGRVPDTIDGLLTLKGVGRKTANLVITSGYGKPGICVDTHVHRITNRWGLVKTSTPDRTEHALRELVPKRYWKDINPTLVVFGQNVCKPVSPLCSRCKVERYCDKAGVTRQR